MMYFWLIPAVVLLVVVLWVLYAAATKRAPQRTEGKTVVDKAPDHPREGT